MNPEETKQKIKAAYTLLLEPTTTRGKFESIQALIKGINPKIDAAFSNCSKTLSDFEKLQKGEIIDLTIEHLPEDTEENKKRKKFLLAFLRNWKQLQSEVERAKKELESPSANNNQTSQPIDSLGRIIGFAKGPFGIITLTAVIIVGITLFLNSNNNNKTPAQQSQVLPATTSSEKKKIQVIVFERKEIPLSELRIGKGPECDSQNNQLDHYHAKEEKGVLATDGTAVLDPGGCGFGKVNQTQVVEVEE